MAFLHGYAALAGVNQGVSGLSLCLAILNLGRVPVGAGFAKRIHVSSFSRSVAERTDSA